MLEIKSTNKRVPRLESESSIDPHIDPLGNLSCTQFSRDITRASCGCFPGGSVYVSFRF